MRYSLRLKKVGLPGLIASVQGEPDIHSAVGTLTHEGAPLLDQMHLKGSPVKIDGPPLTPKQLAAAIAYGSHNSCDRDPSFLRTEMRDFVEKVFWIVLPLEDSIGLNGLRLSPADLIPQRYRRDRIVARQVLSCIWARGGGPHRTYAAVFAAGPGQTALNLEPNNEWPH